MLFEGFRVISDYFLETNHFLFSYKIKIYRYMDVFTHGRSWLRLYEGRLCTYAAGSLGLKFDSPLADSRYDSEISGWICHSYWICTLLYVWMIRIRNQAW